MTAPPILASYHYWRKVDIGDVMGGPETVDVFADSGAFSVFFSGATIRLADYAAWLRDYRTVINFAAALDVIGDWRATRRNADTMRAQVAADGVVVVPTYHVGTPWIQLHELAKDYGFVALGGIVEFGNRVSAVMPWLIRAHRILAEHGAVAHGFGATRPPYPHALPWYSVDSSYWNSPGRTGGLSLWDGRDFVKFRVGRPGARQHAALIRSYGGNPEHVSSPGFGVVRLVGPRGSADRQWLNEASALAYWRYADSIGARRTVKAPPGVRGDGPKMYLAAGSRGDVMTMRRVWQRHISTRRSREGSAA